MSKIFWIFAFSMGHLITANANTTAQDFQAAKEYAKTLGGQPLAAINQFNPESTFKEYNKTPLEERYYQGVEKEKIDLTPMATKSLKDDLGGQTVVNQFGKNKFEINQNNEAIKKAKLIEDESYAITHGLSNQRIKCDETPPSCEMKTHEEHCESSKKLPDQMCVKKLNVSVRAEHKAARADFEVWIVKKWTGIIQINLVTGAMSNNEGGYLTNPLVLPHPCGSIKVTVHNVLTDGRGAGWAHVIGLPSCQNNGVLTLDITEKYHLSDKYKRKYPIQVTLTVDAYSPPHTAEEYWDNGCQSLENSLCHLKEERCSDLENPKLIDNLSVTRPCWEMTNTYSCSSARADECTTQKEKGCFQTGSICSLMENNACTLYEQTYLCQEKVCSPAIACVKDLFCADGDCTAHQATQNDDFDKSILPIAALEASGFEFRKTQATLFGGHPVQCKIWLWNFIDCCSDKGWGKAIHLANCREEDRALGEAKLNYLAHYLGDYCAEKVLGECVEHKRSYCVFDTKMARIIQEEGRLSQLNSKALGDAEHPACAGLSVAELQQLDMGRIDFLSPVYPYPSGTATKEAGILGDVTLNNPDSSVAMDEIKRRIEQKASKL